MREIDHKMPLIAVQTIIQATSPNRKEKTISRHTVLHKLIHPYECRGLRTLNGCKLDKV